MQASSTRGVLIISGHNIYGRIFELDNILLCLVIIPPYTFIAKIISSIMSYFSLRISILRSLVPPRSRSFRSGPCIFFISRAYACFIHQGEVILEMPFLVAPKKTNSARFPRFAILISAMSTCIPPFL